MSIDITLSKIEAVSLIIAFSTGILFPDRPLFFALMGLTAIINIVKFPLVPKKMRGLLLHLSLMISIIYVCMIGYFISI